MSVRYRLRQPDVPDVRTRQRKIAFIVVAIVVLSWGIFWGIVPKLLRLAAYDTKFHEQPSRVVYQKVFQQPPPPGITDLRVSARHYFIKCWAWMRFQATDDALKTLIGNNERLDPAEAERYAQSLRMTPDTSYNADDEQAVGWKPVYSLTEPEMYLIWPGDHNSYEKSGGWMWYVLLVVDRKTHTVYVKATGD